MKKRTRRVSQMDVNNIAYVVMKKRSRPLLYADTDSIMVRQEDVTVLEYPFQEADYGQAGIPNGLYYNTNIDDWDSAERDAQGNWKWTRSPSPKCRQPNLWTCSICTWPKMMECGCGYVMGGNGLFLHRMLEEGEYVCTHRMPDPEWKCRSCIKFIVNFYFYFRFGSPPSCCR